MLWIEPERAKAGTPVAVDHPDWCLSGDPSNLLVDIGNPEAWQWCFDTISELIETNDIDWFRNDANINPLVGWRNADEPNRKGVHEVRYINGLYRLWSELLRRFPHLKIDNCSSGGRRLDFAILRYSVPLWASDMDCYPEVKAEWQQHHVAGLSDWLPVFSLGTQNQAGGDTYNFHSTITSGVVVHYFSFARAPITDGYPHAWLKARLKEFHATKHLYCGDFYLLSDFDTGHPWMIQHSSARILVKECESISQ